MRIKMGFGTEFQGKKSHETLLHIQEQEIKLLENIKRCLQVRIKSDKNYADALSSLVKEAQKFSCPDYLPYCSVFQAWDSIVKQTDKFVDYLNQNITNMTSNTMTRLTDFINDKKAAKKFYCDERNRLSTEFSKVQDEVQRHKTEYGKWVARMSTDEAKYNDSKPKGGKKLEEAKSKYHKSSIRLHRVHNDYVLSLREVMSHQKCYLSQTLPTLLDFHQATQEIFVQQCKDILQEYYDNTNVTSKECCEIFKAEEDAVQKIVPAKEYYNEDFVHTFSSDPLESFEVEFSQALLADYKGTLKSDIIAVDGFTHEELKRRRDDLLDEEVLLQDNVDKKQESYNAAEEKLRQFGPNRQTDVEYLAQRREVEKLRYELADEQAKLNVQQELIKQIKESLDKVGDTVPDVLDFSFDSDKHEDSSNISSTSNHSTSTFGGGLKKIRSNIGGAFTKRTKSTTDEKPQISSYEDNEIETPSNGPLRDSATASNFDRLSNGGLPLEEEEWFHGVLPREEVQRLLVNDGDFIVRESKNRKTNETQYVLSCFWQGHRHFIIQQTDDGWRFEGRSLPTIGELVRYQHRSGEPVTSKSKTILKNPILREQWQLRNDDIALEMKIGNGNFGEVYKGSYKPKNMVVAVKTCKDTLSDDQRKKFLQEGRILKQYDHPNIVRFIGIAAQRQPVMIVMEFVAGGALLSFLRKSGRLQTKKQLTKMCEDAANGMAYLESKNCIHRDLAARNCLVGDKNIVKISDFGMSREEEEYTVSEGLKQIPIKWTAPEALLYGRYTSLCDVWSFGILMWEVFSCGMTPYQGLTNIQAREKLDSGYRMPAPEGTPPAVYDLMRKCWEKNPSDRLHFDGILKELKSIVKTL